LIPYDAAIESPRVKARRAKRDRVDTGSRQGVDQTAAIRADTRRRSDGLLRVDSDSQLGLKPDRVDHVLTIFAEVV
jgi:hypothetical protein